MSSARLFAVVGHDPPQEALDILAGLATLQLFDTPEELVSSGIRPFGLMVGHAPAISEDTMSHLPSLRLLVCLCVGTNHVDLAAAGRRGVAVSNVPAYGTEEVADAAVTHILNLYRRTHDTLLDRSRPGPAPSTPREIGAFAKGITRLRGQKLGLVACGPIGQAVVLRLKPFGFDISFFDPFLQPGIEKVFGIRRHLSLDDMLAESDCLSIHCPLTKGTKHLLNADAFRKMKRGVRIVNTGRGGVIDEDALAVALNNGTVFSAGLDVQEVEPFNWEDSPLKACPNVVCTPHVAWYSDESLAEMWRMAAEEAKLVLINCQQDTPLPISKALKNCVNGRFYEEPSSI